jgi:hypothetical protein
MFETGKEPWKMKSITPQMRASLKIKMLQYESDAWKRVLCFMADENIHLKTRLTDVLKNSGDEELLEQAEYFQNSFVKEDNVIYMLRDDIQAFDRLLVREVFEDGAILTAVVRKLKALRSGVGFAEQRFNNLKTEFNNNVLEYSLGQ